MKKLATLAVLIAFSQPTFSATRAIEKCSELLRGGLTISEVFILLSSRKVSEDGHLPRSGTAVYRLIRMEGSTPTQDAAAMQARFATVLANYKLTLDDWKSLDDITFKNQILGSDEFMAALSKARCDGKKLTEEQIAAVKKLNSAAEAAREKLKSLLSSAERLHLNEHKTFMSEEALEQAMQQFSRDPSLGLGYLGVNSIAEWRYKLITESGLRKEIEKMLRDGFMAAVATTGEISEKPDVTLSQIARNLGVQNPEELRAFFGQQSVYADVNQMIDVAKEKHHGQFVNVIDRREFNEARRNEMIEAVKNANDIIVFKLAEKMDLADFDAIRNLSKSMGNAPIIVTPTFTDIGSVATKLAWLFNEPNVHFLVDQGIQFTRDFYVVDYGYEDKRVMPGPAETSAPTDRMVIFHPRVRGGTRATGNYATRPGYWMTSGSMSDPAYWGKFLISMSTSDKAQKEAELNRSVVVLSRRYKSDKFADLVGSANGIAPRRVRFTPARYGNPAGLFDLGKLYANDGSVIQVSSLPAIVLGDIHLGNTDPLFLKATHETLEALDILEKNPDFGQPMQQAYRPGKVKLEHIVLHDLIEGSPNNRHNMDSLLSRAIDDKRGALELEQHIQQAAAWVKQLTQILPDTTVIVPVDNHGSDWLVKRLQEADLFKAQPKEIPLILQLMIDAIQKKVNPYEQIFKYYGLDPDRVVFLKPASTYRVGVDLQSPQEYAHVQGIELGQHSHQGINGAKSISLQKLLTAYGANVTGHTHSSAEYGQSVKVGTGTPVKQGYHKGPSTSDASIALVYSEQAIQLLRMERGSFVPTADAQSAADFFPGSEYPRVMIRKKPPEGEGTTDQFRVNPPTEQRKATPTR